MAHLLTLVTAHTDTLGVWIAGLDDALTASLRELHAPTLDRRASVLCLIQVSVEEARYNPTCRSLLSATSAPPINIWQREAL